MPRCATLPNTAETERRTAPRCCQPPRKGAPDDQQHPAYPADRRRLRVTATAVLAAIGAVTLILTAATRIPAALTEFLSACVGTVKAARELHTAFTNSPKPRRGTSRRSV
jgi:hypothetical protein